MMLMMMSIEMKFVDDHENMLVRMKKMMKMRMWIELANEDEWCEMTKNRSNHFRFKIVCLLHTCEGVTFIVLVGTVEEREFELVPSEPIAESVVGG